MAIFKIDIERYIISQLENDLDLKGIACIQYPVYSLHCEIGDNSPDPLDGLDRSIAEVLNGVTQDPSTISQLLGVPVSGINARIAHFKAYQYLDSGCVSLNQYGYNTLILGEEKKIKTKSYDFFIDGLNFTPLPEIFYGRNYKQVLIEELSFSSYTNNKGEVVSYNSFSPSIVHKPFDEQKVKELIFKVSSEERQLYKIPVGLVSIEKISFVKMTFPVLIGLFDNNGKPVKKLIDGFKVLGDAQHIKEFEKNLSDRINNLELRLNIKRDRKTYEFYDHDFHSNWDEIDAENEEPKLFWMSKEDLKASLEKIYQIDSIPVEDIIVTPNDIGLNVTGSLLKKCSNKRDLINNLLRGRDYEMTMKFFRTGVWVTFFSFSSNDPFVSELLEVLEFVNKAKEKDLEVNQVIVGLSKYPDHRRMLVLLEEYELLEQIDITLNMKQV